MKISVVIITFNEEQNIRQCLESVLAVADEIVVVDSFSTDRTEAVYLFFRDVVFLFSRHFFAVTPGASFYVPRLDRFFDGRLVKGCEPRGPT